jgi:rhodanese-related sulfurtransferase
MNRKYVQLFLILILALGIMLTACGGAEPEAEAPAEAPVVEEPVEEPEPVEEEVVEEVEEPEPVEEEVAEEPEEEEAMAEEMPAADLDASFTVFLSDMDHYNTISVDDFATTLAEKDVFILDVREPGELEENGWIEGAVNIPLRELADNLEYLPSLDTPILSYCGSGWRCTIATAALEGMGWEDVKCLKGGSFSGWVEAGYPVAEGNLPEPAALNEADPDPALVAEMQTMLQNVPEGFGGISADDLNLAIAENPGLILIDARTPGEVEEKGYIDAPNVEFIPLEEFVANQDMWPEDLGAPIVVYCGSGHRSTLGMSILWTYGYKDVKSLKGGYGAWAEAGYATMGAPETEMAAESILDEPLATFLGDMEAYNTIGIEDAAAALAEGGVFLLDVRQPEELEEKGWIEGAVNIPLRELVDNLDSLPSQDTQIISYCGSGWRCTIAATALEGMGWEDVKCLKGGSFSGWVEAGYPIVEGEIPELEALDEAEPDEAVVAEMQTMLQNVPEGYGGISADDLNVAIAENPDLILIDVRTPGEIEEKGHIDAPNVLFIPLEEFIAQKDMWPADLDAPIVTYCGSGHRSTIAMTILWANGYTDVMSLKGGFGGWAEAGYPVVSTGSTAAMGAVGDADLNAAFQVFLDDMEAYNTIGLDDLNLMMAEGEDVYILDVRQPGELEENGWIEGAVNIPLREVTDSIEYLPSFDTPIVSYCGSGWRCTIALAALEGLGWEDVRGLKGGSFGGWVEAGYPIAEGDIPELIALDVADPDPALLAEMQEMMQAIPEGYGGISADDLNVAIVENPDLILIDVRTAGEVEEKGAIDAPNVVFIPLEEFATSTDMWPADKDAPIVTYCGSGHRSTIAMTILWANDYTDVHSLKGGFGAWTEAGYPVAE